MVTRMVNEGESLEVNRDGSLSGDDNGGNRWKGVLGARMMGE
jgi:hypothetical protein